jgi:flagellar hook-length control protein FliK
MNQSGLKAQLRGAQPSKSTSPLLIKKQNLSVPSSASAQQNSADQTPAQLFLNLIAGTDPAQNQNQSSSTGKLGDSSSQSWKTNLRSQTLRLLQGSSQKTGAAAVTQVQIEMPPTLQGLVEFLNQQPGQALKVPADRISQVQDFLLQAGLPTEQVASLMNSPRFQEMGLTATDVQSAWQKATQNAVKESATALDSNLPLTSGQLANLQTQNITGQSDYQKVWQNLTLPVQALPSLRLQLQELGVHPEALQTLNEQNFPNGIPLTQVWQFIQQASKSVPAAPASSPANNTAMRNNPMESPLLLSGGKDLDNWRQLLVEAGMDAELAQTMTSASTPANQEELRASLLQMAPPAAPSQSQLNAKPVYLPENVRLRQIPVLQQANAGQSQGGGSGNSGNLDMYFGSSPKPQELNLPGAAELHNFLTLLTDGASLKAEQLQSTEASGGSSSAVNSLLTPEAREALWSQVQTGVLGNLRPGENQITLTLNPPEMGKLNLTLNVKGAMVEITATATHPAVAEAATAGVQQLAQALNQQGLILTQCQFHLQDEAPQGQTQFAFSQSSEDQRQAGKKDANSDRWERPTTPRQRRWAGGIDCFA